MELSPRSVNYKKSINSLAVIFLGFHKLETIFAPIFPLLKVLDKCLLHGGPVRKISHFYDSLQSINPPSMLAIRTAWENELGIKIPDETWEEGLEEVNACSINSRHCLIQVIHRLHYSKSKLHKMFPDISPTCDKCNMAEDDLLHSFSLCPRIERFCVKISKTFSDVLKIHTEPDPIYLNHTGNFRPHIYITKNHSGSFFFRRFDYSWKSLEKEERTRLQNEA